MPTYDPATLAGLRDAFLRTYVAPPAPPAAAPPLLLKAGLMRLTDQDTGEEYYGDLYGNRVPEAEAFEPYYPIPPLGALPVDQTATGLAGFLQPGQDVLRGGMPSSAEQAFLQSLLPDAGSFVLDPQGVAWAVPSGYNLQAFGDFGRQATIVPENLPFGNQGQLLGLLEKNFRGDALVNQLPGLVGSEQLPELTRRLKAEPRMQKPAWWNSGIVGSLLDFVPLVGGFKNIAAGIEFGNPLQIAGGAGSILGSAIGGVGVPGVGGLPGAGGPAAAEALGNLGLSGLADFLKLGGGAGGAGGGVSELATAAGEVPGGTAGLTGGEFFAPPNPLAGLPQGQGLGVFTEAGGGLPPSGAPWGGLGADALENPFPLTFETGVENLPARGPGFLPGVMGSPFPLTFEQGVGGLPERGPGFLPGVMESPFPLTFEEGVAGLPERGPGFLPGVMENPFPLSFEEGTAGLPERPGLGGLPAPGGWDWLRPFADAIGYAGDLAGLLNLFGGQGGPGAGGNQLLQIPVGGPGGGEQSFFPGLGLSGLSPAALAALAGGGEAPVGGSTFGRNPAAAGAPAETALAGLPLPGAGARTPFHGAPVLGFEEPLNLPQEWLSVFGLPAFASGRSGY